MFSLNTVFQRVILQSKSHWKLHLFGFLEGTEDQFLGLVVIFFFLVQNICAVFWDLAPFGLVLLISYLFILHSLQLSGLKKFLPLMRLKLNIYNVLLNQNNDKFVFSLCSGLRFLNSTKQSNKPPKCVYIFLECSFSFFRVYCS